MDEVRSSEFPSFFYFACSRKNDNICRNVLEALLLCSVRTVKSPSDTEPIVCFLCDKTQNIPIHHNTKRLWLYCEWFKLGLLTFNAYFSFFTRSIPLWSPESVDGCGHTSSARDHHHALHFTYRCRERA